MIYNYSGNYGYSLPVLTDWNSGAMGVYYCGYISTNGLIPLYIGKGTGDGGMRTRLLCHVREDYWPDVTHFGFHACSSVPEAESLEVTQIKKFQPKYNIHHK